MANAASHQPLLKVVAVGTLNPARTGLQELSSGKMTVSGAVSSVSRFEWVRGWSEEEEEGKPKWELSKPWWLTSCDWLPHT